MSEVLLVPELVEDPPLPIIEHLSELRKRLLYSLALWTFVSAAVFDRSGAILTWLAKPAGGLVFQAPAEAFYTRLQVAGYAGFVLALPLILHQAWLFISPAVSRTWKRLLTRLLPASYGLFMLGVGLAVFGVVPGALRFLLGYGSEGVRPLLTLAAYLDFVTGLSLAFGGVFQLPLVLYGLNRAEVLSRERLSEARRLVYLLCFIGGALLTPGPDMVLQMALALPAVVLFELTLLVMD